MDAMKKTTIYLDPALLTAAKAATGKKVTSDVIRQGLEALVRLDAARRISAMYGTEATLQETPRRREQPRAKPKRKRAA
jgi:hypothetical protein